METGTEHVWTEIRGMTGDVPSNLQDHTMIGWKGCLHVFGGEVGFASTGETPLWVYDIATNHWSKLTCTDRNARQPKGCRGHTAVVYANSMYIYGGYRDLKGSTNELWTYDFEKRFWWPTTYTGCSEVPSGRHDHSVVVHDASMWVYGGMTDLQAKADFWKWDFVSRQWSRVRSKGCPGELHGHTACKVLNSMVLFGGERSGQLLNEIWRFYFATDVWEKLVYHGSQPSPRSRHLTVVVPTLLLLLPHLYADGGGCASNNHQTPQHKQRQFQALVSSGSYAPSFSPGDSSDLEPPPPDVPTTTTRALPKSETMSNCRDVTLSMHGVNENKTTISGSFSHTNFKFLRERISTSNLFKAQNASYMALSNSSESVQDDSAAAGQSSSTSSAAVVFGAQPRITARDNNRTVHVGSRSIYNFADSNNVEKMSRSSDCHGVKLNNKNTGTNNRLYERTMLSVPNFQKIQSLEMRGLMEDLSDNSSVDSARFTLNVIDNQAYSITPKKAVTAPLNSNNWTKRHSSYIPNRGGIGLLDNGAYCHQHLLPGMVAAQDSLENIPDIKDSTVGETASIKLIDLEADCDEVIGSKSGSLESTSPSTSASSSPLDTPSDDAAEDNGGQRRNNTAAVVQPRPTLPAVSENMAWQWESSHHKDYAHCLNVATTPDGPRWPNLELKAFPRLTSFDEVDTGDDFVQEQNNVGGQCPPPPSNDKAATVVRQKDNGNRAPNSRHFSMLVMGGRENGVSGCGRTPITVWKLDFWK